MAISSYDDPRGSSFTTSKLLPLDDHLSFSSLLKTIYLLSYSKSSSTTSTSKAIIDEIPMVVIIVWGLVKCKLQVAIWISPCSLPRVAPLVEISSHLQLVFSHK